MSTDISLLRLVVIGEDGTPAEVLGPLSEHARTVCAQTASLYKSVGFAPPWVGYLGVAGSEVIGTCAFTSAPRSGRVEIAYFTFPSNEGRGFATSMAQALVAIAKDEPAVQVVFAHTLPVENASNSILKKLGFEFVGAIPQAEEGTVWEWQTGARA